MKLNQNRFSKILQELIRFKAGTTRVPIRAENWEELIWAALAFMFGDENINWDPQSHEKSVDITVKMNRNTIKISAKAGEIKNNIIPISSYRLTTFNSLNEKLSFIRAQASNFDFYIICAREVKKDNIIYYVIKASSHKLAPKWLTNKKNWIKTNGGYILKDDFEFMAKIIFKMSDQLWLYIPIKYFSKKEIISIIKIPIDSLGKGLLEYLKEHISLF